MSNLIPLTFGVDELSIANKELVQLPEGWTVKEFKTIEFISPTDCTLIINNREVRVMGNGGLKLDNRFKPIESLKIKEDGIRYYLVAGV